MPKQKITTVTEDYIGRSYSAAEGERGSLTVIRWADFATMKLAASGATTAIVNGLMEMQPDEIDFFLARLDGRYEAPNQCLRLPIR